MAERFSASAAFTNMSNNNNNTDGWGDDWGDWNDTMAADATGSAKPFSTKQPAYAASANTPTGNQYFQQQPLHPSTGGPYLDGGSVTANDHHNHNYLSNQNAPSGHTIAAGNAGYRQPPFANVVTPVQQNYAPPPPQTSYGQANNFFNSTPSQVKQAVPPHRPPSHPAASVTPQLIPTFSQTISDSFDTSGGNSWNWNVGGDAPRHPASVSQSQDVASSKPSPPTSSSSPSRHYEDVQQQQQQVHGPAPVQNISLQRLKAETLSPQWSIESQVSSSDRSLGSEHIPDTKSSSQPPTTVPSDEDLSGVGTVGMGPQSHFASTMDGVESTSSYNQPSTYAPYQSASQPKVGIPDRLDEVLEALSIKQEPREPSYREQSFPPPPPSIAGSSGGPMVNESLNHPSKSSSTTPPLPPPPVDSGSAALAVGPPPPPSSSSVPMGVGPPPKPPVNTSTTASNPFKRAGGRSHIATPGLAMVPPSAPSVVAAPVAMATANGGGSPFYYQQQLPTTMLQPQPPGEESNNVESLTPENQEILVESRTSEVVENHEIAPSNDRNQYLQTGHLSEDGYGVDVTGTTPRAAHLGSAAATTTTASSLTSESNDRRLPPPGLSRYVPGQNQQQPDPSVQPAGQSFPEPPPGLDRMVPGMDLPENAANLSLLERQADGEVSDSTPPSVPLGLPPSSSAVASSAHVSQHYHHSLHHNHERVDMSDRNLYRVPGESDNHHHNQQRVVPGGVENDRTAAPITTSGSPSGYGQGVGGTTVSTVSTSASSAIVVGGPAAVATLDIPEEQRELVMDGENPDDQREEPLVGGNPEPTPTSSGGPTPMVAPTLETDSNATNEPSRNVHEPSNTSTADESDKGGFYGAAAIGSKGRREDDSLRRSNKSKSSRDRYDTEDSDYSEHERRRRERESSLGTAAGAGPSGGATGGALADASTGNHRHDRPRHRTAGGAERDKDKRKDTGRDRDRERDRDRDRDQRDRGDRDYDYRDRERTRYDRDRERYGGRSGKYDRETRYETDGSKYETERSTRYDKDDKRYSSRDDYYRKRDERGTGPDDGRATGAVAGRDRDRDRDANERRQRKEKERSDRYRGEERRKDDRYRDGDKRRDRHDRRYDPEDYRTGSRNGTERDRARDSRDRDDRKEKTDGRKYMAAAGYGSTGLAGAAAGGAYGPASGYYDPYSYYVQHQQYYEQLRRTNPQAYAEWYRTYYAQMQASQLQRDLLTTDGRESVHSGRSSANDKERMDQIDASISKADTATELSMMEPERLTPRKFPEIHPIVSVSAGLLISTKNRLTMNGMADTVKIYSLGSVDISRKLFQAYPGPLVKGVTHKKSVIEFCEEQLRQGPPYSGALALIKSRGNSINSLHSSSLAAGANRSSFALLWNYIILLLRQNGTFVGTDISELLMQNKSEYPFESIQASAIRSANISGRNSSLSVATADRGNPREADARQDGESDEAADPSPDASHQDSKELVEAPAAKGCLSELDITDKFRNYLLYGNIGEALEWATEHNLWGHALFLASKVDSRQHANVMMKFANKLTLNDPLQTLYQLLSGRTPASVTSVLDEKWGDWRPHLAMLMSNSSAKPELIKKSITTLGDTLYNRGDLYASHFCYLLSDVAFGRYADVKQDASNAGVNGAVRLVLLGAAHHHRNFRELSTNESIMMTEIYEYARSLNEERYSITELQRYKYLLACRMLDQGMQLKCLLYMEQIAEQIQLDSYRFDTEFVRKVYTLGDRLKYYDPVMEKALDESVDNTGRGNIYANVEDPEWLQRLNGIILSNGNSSLGASNYNNNEGPISYDYNAYGHASEQHAKTGGTAVGQEQPSASSYPAENETSDINKQFNEISQQLGQLNLQYSDQQQQQSQYQQPQSHAVAGSGAQLQHQQSFESGAVASYDQGYESINQQHSLLDPVNEQSAPQLHQPQDASGFAQSQQQFNQYNNYEQHQQQQVVGGTNIFTPGPLSGGNDPTLATDHYDGAYWGAAAGNNEVPKPTISMPNAASNRPGFNNDETDDERTAQQKHSAANGGAKPPQPNGGQSKKAPLGKDAKALASAAGGGQGSGWFGGIWNKFSLKPKNQMILPDDKNPKIVWDEVTKRWVNTDEAEAETEAYKPPPKMSDLMPTVSGPTAPGPGPPAPVPMGPAMGGGGPIQLMQPQDAGPVAFTQHPNVMAANSSMSQPPVQPIGAPIQSSAASAAPSVEPTKVPTLQSNMYKMQRNRTLKRSYVDVFNPSGAGPSRPTETVMAPTVPSIPTSAQGGFFVPSGGPHAGGAGQQSVDAAEGMPQFYNPNQFADGSNYQQ